MRILVTAGNTHAPIDRVRSITNIFTGRTGASIAREAVARGHHVTIATSQTETIDDERVKVCAYRTFDELETLMAKHIEQAEPDAVIHSAAVSDYLVEGVYAAPTSTPLGRIGKIKSDEPELWLRLVKAPKLVDKIRRDWNFAGLLVKFKLEVDVSDSNLLVIAEKSRLQSEADWMVANTLDGAGQWAFLGNSAGYHKVTRADLPTAILTALEMGAHHA